VLSRTVEYALRATLYVARHKPRVMRLREIARAVHAPPRYLAKILGQLARDGILASSRGRDGGFCIAPARENASLAEIVAVFEASEPRRCLLGHGLCGQVPSCPVHEKWNPIARSTAEFFADTTLNQLQVTRPST
jgi:Rrf2 family transcriptional regulator, nitric oxide-sensitive transcriptional repressor